jgi:o-succinylbenzoate synthase
VTIARVRLRELALPLVRPLRTAHGEIHQREGWLVELEDAAGIRGFGEALPLPTFGGEARNPCGAALRAALPLLLGTDPADALPPEIDAVTARAPVARAALETAVLDRSARRGERSLAQQLGARQPLAELRVNALLSATTPDGLAQQAAAAAAAGYETLKLKLGAQALDADLACAHAVRSAAPSGVALRLDANGAWSEREARAALRALAKLQPEWVEQPVAPGDPRTLARLRSDCGVAIAADEAACSPQAVRELLAADAVDALVIKLPPLGGLTCAREIALLAHERGVRVAVTSFLDSSIGIAAAAQLAASLPEPLPACGLATAPLLADDLAEPWCIERGRLQLPVRGAPGLGCEPAAAALERLCGEAVVEASS